MDQTVDVKNAMGVAFLRLRKFEEANQYSQMALSLAKETEDKACILSNMSEVMMYTGDFESAEKYMETALNQETGDSVEQLVLRSNMAAINSTENKDNLQKAIELKKLLKEEKRICNSNQFVGIFNYKTLAYICCLDGI
jgi:Flp pilus assembly protein TadD